MAKTTDQEAAAQDQQDIGEDTTQHTGLNDTDLVVLEGNDTDLYSIQRISMSFKSIPAGLCQKFKNNQTLTINSTALPKVAFIRPPKA